MNREPSSSPSECGPEVDELSGVLREAVEQIRAASPPHDTMVRVINQAAWAGAEHAIPLVAKRRRWTGRWALASAAAVGFILVSLAAGYWSRQPAPPDTEPPGPGPIVLMPNRGGDSAASDAPRVVPPMPPVEEEPVTPRPPEPAPVNPFKDYSHMLATNDGATTPGFGRIGYATTAGVQAMSGGGLAGTSPIPFMAVADKAPFLVSTGDDKPIRLGDKLRYDPAKDDTLHIWDWSKSTESRPFRLARRVGGMAVSPDGKWVVARDGRLIDAANGQIKQLDNFDGDVHGMLFSPNGDALLLTIRKADRVSSARMLDFPSGKKRFEIDGQWWFTFAGVFTRDGKEFLLMDKDRFIRRWDAQTGKELSRYEPAFTNSVRAIAVSADAKYMAAAASAPVDTLLWELAGGKLLHRLPPKQKHEVYSEVGISALAFSPDGKLLAGAGAYSALLWATDSGKVARLFPTASGNASALRFSKDGKTLTTIHGFYGVGANTAENLVSYPFVRDWNVETGEQRK
jgi:hypothetical protein